MPFTPTNVPVLRIRMLGVADGQAVDNIWYASYGGTAPSAADCATFAGDANGVWKTAFQSYVSDWYTLEDTEVTDIYTDTGSQGTGGATYDGTGGSNFVPNSLCGVVSWKIARHYRGGKPRWYIGPLGYGFLQDARTMTDAHATALAAAADTLVTSFIGLTVGGTTISQVGTISRVLDGTPRTTFLFEPFVLPPTVDVRVGSQRRRLGKLSADRP